MEKREPSCTVGGNVNYYIHYGEQYGDSLKKLELELPYDPAIQLLDYWENHKSKIVMYHNIHCSSIYNNQDMEAT